MKEIIQRIYDFVEVRDWDQFHSPVNLSKSIVIEAAELLECFQWNEDVNIDNAKEELADVMIYAILLARKLDLDIETIISDKINKNNEKYNVEKSRGNSKKYNEL